jgi:uncharacterized cupredoxin-like copper-binding protein
MQLRRSLIPLSSIFITVVALSGIARNLRFFQAFAHEAHDAHFSAGEPGNSQNASRTVKVAMAEDGKRMLFDPPVITVRLGEQIRFVLFNEGTEDHEFILATRAENREHAVFMKKFPNMEHNDPNAKRLSALDSGELGKMNAEAKAFVDGSDQHLLTMKPLISLGSAKMTSARSPIIPAPTKAGAFLSGPSALASVFKRRLRSQNLRVCPFAVVTA